MKSTAILCAALAGVVAATQASAGAPPPAGDEAVLLVNGEPIMRSSIDKLLKPLQKAKVPQQQFVQYQQRLVQNIIMDMLLDQFLRKDGFKPTREEIEIQVKRRERLYGEKPNPLSFAEALRRSGTSVNEMRANPDPRLRFSCYIRRGLTEQDLARTYETEKDSWAKVRARHVLIATRGMKTDEEKAAARTKAEAIRARILAGEDFAELAAEFSGCGSKQTGGDLGFFARRGQMVEPFAKAAFALDVDGVSPVVETQFGYHVIQTTDARKGEAPLEEVREYVADAAAERRGQEIYAEIRGKAKIERPRPPGGPRAPTGGVRPGGVPAPRPPAPAPR
ncbi:MAG: peptidylprolyl isomerase [Planctomycetota bacterium]|jgi:parvulin-like peptidyl-prolyl isomerase